MYNTQSKSQATQVSTHYPNGVGFELVWIYQSPSLETVMGFYFLHAIWETEEH